MPPLTTRNSRMGNGESSSGERKFRLPSWHSKSPSSQNRASISSVCLPETSNCYFPDEEATPGAKEAFYEKLKLKYECMPCHVFIAATDIVDPSIVIKWRNRFPDKFDCILHSERNEIKLLEKLPRSSTSAATAATKTNRMRSENKLPGMGQEITLPRNMDELIKKGLFYQKLDCVNIEHINEQFIWRAEKGAVDWNLFFKNATQEAMACQLYKDSNDAKSDGSPYTKLPSKKRTARDVNSDIVDDEDDKSSCSSKRSRKKSMISSSIPANDEDSIDSTRVTRSLRKRQHHRNVYIIPDEDAVPDSTTPDEEFDDIGEGSSKKTPKSKKNKSSPFPVKTVPSPNRKGTKEDKDFIITLKAAYALDATKIIYPDRQEYIITLKDRVLAHCNPPEIGKFSDILSQEMLDNCTKIGEGTHAEVYLTRDRDHPDLVIKVIPFETEDGQDPDCDECFGKILPELMVSKFLNGLRRSDINKSPNFNQMIRSACVRGRFPKKLIVEFDKYAKRKWTQNWHPDCYDDNYLHMVMLLQNGGTDLESFEFDTAEQAVGLILQIIFSLAAAEVEYQFEHRDLHWGNVLIKRSSIKYQDYSVDDVSYTIPTGGVIASLIDFSLSRMRRCQNVIYEDLSEDKDLFSGKGATMKGGDYQFDIYRKMREHNGNNWEPFNPKTNIFWIHYLLDKLVKKAYRYEEASQHIPAMIMLTELKERVEKFDSCRTLVESSLTRNAISKFKNRFEDPAQDSNGVEEIPKEVQNNEAEDQQGETEEPEVNQPDSSLE